MSDEIEDLVAFLSLLPEEFLRSQAEEYYRRCYEGFGADCLETILNKTAKVLDCSGVASAVEERMQNEGSTLLYAAGITAYSHNTYGGKSKLSGNPTRGLNRLVDYFAKSSYSPSVLEKDKQEGKDLATDIKGNAQIDLAKEAIANLVKIHADVDMAKLCLEQFESEYVGVSEAAVFIERDPSLVRKFAREGRMGVLVDGRYLFTRRELAEYMNKERPSGIHRE